ncbi:carveol dehydrogenase domain protein [Mycobacterium xenopi 4042]|uniref:Carveol dehydrogenase domain protein n=1 Tax=Mycobacterium xenopi 4042 TaxID=1299334 RepID=X7ZVS5_MYCXE|nr:carveol dehydrogenase domain protein [Mycobacterium xenopi 4042]
MVINDAMAKLVAANDVALAAMQNALPIQILQPEDIAAAVAWLVSDEAKFITGVAWPWMQASRSDSGSEGQMPTTAIDVLGTAMLGVGAKNCCRASGRGDRAALHIKGA